MFATKSKPMKKLYSVLAATLLFGTTLPPLRAAVEVSVDFFHDHLESYGDWREVGDYGWCWQPRDVGRNWRPYSDGRWLYTDAGWTWDSEEPYSWAVYHYGRWARVARVGWVWVPGTEWGPAWVSWRRSARHVGWAPLPPEARFNRTVGFSTRVDADYDIGPTYYSFVEARNFGAPRLRTVIIEPRENITIIRQTTNITRITYVNNVVYNEGPQYDVISRESAQPIRRLKLERREELDGDPGTVRVEQLRTRVEGDSFRVLALPFDAKPATAPRKVAAKVEKAEVDRGWKDAGPAAEVEKLRTKIKSEPATPAELAPTKTEKTAETPAVSPIPPAAPDEKPVQGKMRDAGVPTVPAAPVTTEVAPPSPEKPAAPNKPEKVAKPSKEAKPEKPEESNVRPSPPAVEEAAPSSQSKKGKMKDVETPRPPAEAAPEAPAPVKKKENIEPPRKLAPAAEETVPSGSSKKGKNKATEAPHPPAEAPPEAPGAMRKKESVEPVRNLPPAADEEPRKKNHPGKGDALPKPEPPARIIERQVPNNPEPRPQAVPAAPQPPPPAKEGKGKGKNEKKEEEKKGGAPQ